MFPLQVDVIVRLERYLRQDLVPGVIEFGGQLLAFVLTFAVVYLVGKAVVLPLLSRIMQSRDLEPDLVKPARKITLVGVYFVGIAVAMAVANFGNLLTSLATIAAALTLAIGFASQDLIGNLVAGAFLIATPQLSIGDWIEWNDKEGEIEDISFRASRVRTFDNELILVPNSELANTAITNPVAKDKLRIKFLFGVGYEDDLDHAKSVIVEEAESQAEILDDPEPTVRITELADSYVGIQSRFWIENPDRADFMKVRSEYVQAVKERCDAEEIELPYPYRQLTGGVDVTEQSAEMSPSAD